MDYGSNKASPEKKGPRPDTAPRILTGEDCAELLADLKEVLVSAGLKPEEMALWNDLEEVRWLSKQTGPVLGGCESPGEITRDRRIRGFRDAVSIKRSIRALELARGMEGFRTPGKRIRNWRIADAAVSSTELDRAQQASDYLFEIEVAARLSFTFKDIRFDEPDLVIEDSDKSLSWTVACKRPRATKNVAKAARNAADQIHRKGPLGIVMLSFDHLVEPVVVDLSGRSLAPLCESRVDVVVDNCGNDVLAAIQPYPPQPASIDTKDSGKGVLGVLATTTFFLVGKDGEDGPIFANTRLLPTMINRNSPDWARQAVYFLLAKIEVGENELRTRY